MKFQDQDQKCAAKDQAEGGDQHDLRMKPEMAYTVFPGSPFPKKILQQLYYVHPDDKTDAAEDDEEHGDDIDPGMRHVIHQRAVANDVHACVAEGRYGIKKRVPDPLDTKLRDKDGQIA